MKGVIVHLPYINPLAQRLFHLLNVLLVIGNPTHIIYIKYIIHNEAYICITYTHPTACAINYTILYIIHNTDPSYNLSYMLHITYKLTNLNVSLSACLIGN